MVTNTFTLVHKLNLSTETDKKTVALTFDDGPNMIASIIKYFLSV